MYWTSEGLIVELLACPKIELKNDNPDTAGNMVLQMKNVVFVSLYFLILLVLNYATSTHYILETSLNQEYF